MSSALRNLAIEVEARRVLRRIERKISYLSCPSSAEAAHAAMRLGLIFDCRRSCIARLSGSKIWETVCSACADRFCGIVDSNIVAKIAVELMTFCISADMLLEGTEDGKLWACEALAALTQVKCRH